MVCYVVFNVKILYVFKLLLKLVNYSKVCTTIVKLLLCLVKRFLITKNLVDNIVYLEGDPSCQTLKAKLRGLTFIGF